MGVSNAKMDIIYRGPHVTTVEIIVYNVRYTIHVQNVSEENMELNVTVIVEAHALHAQAIMIAWTVFLGDTALTASLIVL